MIFPNSKRYVGAFGVSIACTTRRDGERSVNIRVQCPHSSITILDMDMTLKDFAEAALVHLVGMPGHGTLIIDDRIGRKMEVKREFVPWPEADRYKDFERNYSEAVKPFEVDGWVADHETSFNNHRVRKGRYEVTFRRWV